MEVGAVLVGPLRAGVTWRRALHLLLGAALTLPYAGVAALFVAAFRSPGGADDPAFLLLLVPAAAIGVGVAFVPGVRTVEVAAARALLGVALPDVEPGEGRSRAAAWLLLNLVAGALAALLVLTVVPSAVALLLAPWRPAAPLPTGAAAWWAPPLALALPVLLGHALAAGGAALARSAPRFLGPSERERLTAALRVEQARGDALAERARLARELHDSVGHALTVTTLQAGAAARVLHDDPAFAARALDAIAASGRAALADLDHVLGLLRDDGESSRAPQPDLRDLDGLLAGTRAAGVAVEVHCEFDAVPAAVSREAYRVVQEGLTNALRHAGPVPVTVRVVATEDALDVEVANLLGTGRPGGGRGLTGLRERVAVLGGQLTAGPDGGVWRLSARLPLAP